MLLSFLAASILTFFSCFRNEIIWLAEKIWKKKMENNIPVQLFHKEGIFTSKRNENQMTYAKKWRHFIVVFIADHHHGRDHHQMPLVFPKGTILELQHILYYSLPLTWGIMSITSSSLTPSRKYRSAFVWLPFLVTFTLKNYTLAS